LKIGCARALTIDRVRIKLEEAKSTVDRLEKKKEKIVLQGGYNAKYDWQRNVSDLKNSMRDLRVLTQKYKQLMVFTRYDDRDIRDICFPIGKTFLFTRGPLQWVQYYATTSKYFWLMIPARELFIAEKPEIHRKLGVTKHNFEKEERRKFVENELGAFRTNRPRICKKYDLIFKIPSAMALEIWNATVKPADALKYVSMRELYDMFHSRGKRAFRLVSYDGWGDTSSYIYGLGRNKAGSRLHIVHGTTQKKGVRCLTLSNDMNIVSPKFVNKRWEKCLFFGNAERGKRLKMIYPTPWASRHSCFALSPRRYLGVAWHWLQHCDVSNIPEAIRGKNLRKCDQQGMGRLFIE